LEVTRNAELEVSIEAPSDRESWRGGVSIVLSGEGGELSARLVFDDGRGGTSPADGIPLLPGDEIRMRVVEGPTEAEYMLASGLARLRRSDEDANDD
jgi:hypothetical protein